MEVFLGIDPGNEGAIAVIPAGRADKIIFHDTPLIEIQSGNKTRKVMNVPAAKLMLRAVLSMYSADQVLCVIEKVVPMPSTHGADKGAKMGATSAFNFGKGVGLWIGLLCGLDIPYEEVHPSTWKAALLRDMGKEKGASIVKATQLYPLTAKYLTRKKDHGRADALLLARYGLMKNGWMESTITAHQEREENADQHLLSF